MDKSDVGQEPVFNSKPYVIILRAFIDGRLSADEAQLLYFAVFLREPAQIPSDWWPALNDAFYAFEDYDAVGAGRTGDVDPLMGVLTADEVRGAIVEVLSRRIFVDMGTADG